jgi:aspartyl-tRNA(Asn)/glutamyl-tRNA(Gln) amidotransferase subunit A
VPGASAEAVVRLEAAGYRLVGKTNLHEFAYGVTSENEHYGDVVNPLDRARSPGGSSGGSAVVLACGRCEAALGSDSGGSIRIPAACCGVVGFKPTFGLVPTDGLFPLAPSFDHAGPMARSVADCAAATAALVPGLAATPLPSLEEVEVGVAWLELAEPLVRARLEEAAGRFPRRRPVAFPLADGVGPAFQREVAGVHGELFAEHRALYGRNVRTKIERCLAVDDATFAAATRARAEHRKRAEEALRDVDLLLAPTLMFVAPPTGIPELELREAMIRLTFPLNALGWPALALPCGSAEHGLPASVSLIGRPGADELVLAAGLALEQALAGS